MPRVTKLGALKVLDEDMWKATMKLAFEEGRTAEEASAWLKEKGYGDVSPRQLRDQVMQAQKELGHTLKTERPPEVVKLPKLPCKTCKGFGHLDPKGLPSLRTGHARCVTCGGTGRVNGEART